MSAYSFTDFSCTFNGPNGSFSLGSHAGNADEGITFAMSEDKNTMTIGAGGAVMHSLHAANGGVATVRLLKTSPTNQLLMNAYNAQRASSALWGTNVLAGTDTARGDSVTCQRVAFKKIPDLTYAKEGGMNEWQFDCGTINEVLGNGQPALS